MIIRENTDIMVELGDRVAVNNPQELLSKLNELALRVDELLPLGYSVTLARTGQTTFLFGIASQRNIVVQQFGITWNPETKFVTWAAVL